MAEGRNIESLDLPSPSSWLLLWCQLWAYIAVSYCHDNAAKQTISKTQWFPTISIYPHIGGCEGKHSSPDVGWAQRGALLQTAGWVQVHSGSNMCVL